MTSLQLYLDDVMNGCSEVADNSVDVSFTSPPYFEVDGYTDDLMRALGRIWARVMGHGRRAYLNFGQIQEKFDRPLDAQRLVLEGANGKLVAWQEIIWIKSIAVGGWDEEAHCPDCGAQFDVAVPTLSRGHYQPITSKQIMHYCWEHVFTFIKQPAKKKDVVPPLDRLAIGVPFADKSNLDRGTRGQNGDVHCAGDIWFIPRPITNDNAQWLALLIDTAGHIGMRKEFTDLGANYSIYLQVISESQDLLKAAHQKIGFGELKGRSITFVSKEAASVLRRVYPFLLAKKKFAVAALHAESDGVADDVKEKLLITINDLCRGQPVDTSWVPEPSLSEPDAWYIPYSTTGPSTKKAHRHQFPIELPTRAIKLSGVPSGSLVFDPFMGSGTTAFAARELGMRSVGYDRCKTTIKNLRHSWEAQV